MLRLYFYTALFNVINVNWSLIISLFFFNRQLSIDVRIIEPFLLYDQPFFLHTWLWSTSAKFWIINC